LFNPAITFTVSPFTDSTGCSTTWTYNAERVTLLIILSPLPSFITLTGATFTVISSNPADAGTYSIKLTGVIDN
jgi:hypothetical protein